MVTVGRPSGAGRESEMAAFGAPTGTGRRASGRRRIKQQHEQHKHTPSNPLTSALITGLFLLAPLASCVQLAAARSTARLEPLQNVIGARASPEAKTATTTARTSGARAAESAASLLNESLWRLDEELGASPSSQSADLFNDPSDDYDVAVGRQANALALDYGADTAHQTAPESSAQTTGALVRQLSELPTNEPASISDSLEVSGGARPQVNVESTRGHFVREPPPAVSSPTPGRSNQTVEGRARRQLSPSASNSGAGNGTSTVSPEDSALATIESIFSTSGDEFSPGEPVTCSPDYEDQAVVIDTGNANEMFGSGANSAADSPGLETGGSPHASSNLMVGQCVPAGSSMIEVITKIITPILFSIIIVVGLLGNIIVILVILEDRKLERELTPTNLLILDLSLADLSFIIFCIPFTGWDYAVGHWVFGSLWCKFNQYLIVVCALSSIYTLVLMSCDRFMAIVYPIECINYRTSKNMLHAIIIKWIVILLIASPTILVHGLIDSPLGPDQYNCRFLADQHNPLHFQIIFFITSYLFPLILIFCLYLSLLNKLWFGQKPQGHKESHKMLESKKRVTWLVASIVIVFAACWFPIQIMLILMRLKSHKITATYVAIQVFAHTLGYMNSCVNPIVYAFASETFNQSFKKSRLGRLCLCCYGSSPHDLNSQANNPTNGLNGPQGNHTNMQSTNNHQHHHFKHSTLTLNYSNDFGAGGSSQQRLNSRNSLQVTSLDPSSSNSARNQSLGHIFSGQHQRRAATATSHLKLEPRDRPQAPPQPPPPQVSSASPSTMIMQPPNLVTIVPTNANQCELDKLSSEAQQRERQEHQQTRIDLSIACQQNQIQQRQKVCGSPPVSTNEKLVPRQPTSSPKVLRSLQKQQLVARITSQSSNNGNQVVAHQCEPATDNGDHAHNYQDQAY